MYKLDLFSRQTEFPSRGTDPVPSSPEDTLENCFSVDLTWSLSFSHGHGFFHVKFWLPGGTSVNTNYHCKTLFWSTKLSPHMAVHQHSGPPARRFTQHGGTWAWRSTSTAVHQHSCQSARRSISTVMVRSNLETELPRELKVKCWLSHFFFLSLPKQIQREPCSVKQNIGKGFNFYIIQLGGGRTHL